MFFSSTLNTKVLKSQELSNYECTVLKICEGVIQLFKQFPDSVWPGYNLAERPFIVYIPGKWALLFNYTHDIDGFTAYPEEWPDLGTNVLFHKGKYQGLVGQLIFNFKVDTLKTLAIGFPEKFPELVQNLEVKAFGYIVHEAFHQYQHESFGNIPWAREEKYPILDRENSALSYLEMSLLMDALKTMKKGNKEQVREYVKQFVAVREYRWKRSDPFVAKYEQGQEIREGTAKYVELKSIDLMGSLEYKSSLIQMASSMKDNFRSTLLPEYLIRDFQDRIAEDYVPPEDMIRNKIYPVGSAQGFLLDYFGIDWKERARQAGDKFTFTQLFKNYLSVNEDQLKYYVEIAKKNYDYDKIVSATDNSIKEYLDGYHKEFEEFENQSGYRIEVVISSRSMSRSRISKAKKWIVNKGSKSLCNNYQVYTLKNNDLILQVHDSGLFEQNDWDSRIKNVVFFSPEISSFSLNGSSTKFTEDLFYQFETIEVLGENFKFSYSKKGTIKVTNKSVIINLIS
jgi:hypothetical protein